MMKLSKMIAQVWMKVLLVVIKSVEKIKSLIRFNITVGLRKIVILILDKFKVSNLYDKLKGNEPEYKFPKKITIPHKKT